MGLVHQDNYERQLEIHEIAEPDVQESLSGATISEIEDQESLRALRTMHLRFSILRRLFLCQLLSLEAHGTPSDKHPWKTALYALRTLAHSTGQFAEHINALLREEDERQHAAPNNMSIPIPSTPNTTNTHRSTPEKERYRNHLRKTNELASELRTMQTKLLILRDDVSRILEGGSTASTTSIPALFTTQAESFGADLKSLTQTYESWKYAITPAPDRPDKRLSWTSSGLRSPVSLGGLTVVDELGAMNTNGGPSDALRLLSGASSASGGGSPNASGSMSDEEVFEAVAMPRVLKRTTWTREEKIAKLQEEEVKRAAAREQRAASSGLMRELESVMAARSLGMGAAKRMSTGRLMTAASRVSSL
jgi:vezatin